MKTFPVQRLQGVDQFRSLKRTQLRVVQRLTEQVEVGEGKILVKEGQFGNEFFLIVSGSAEVTQKGQLVNELGPGDFFGVSASLSRGTRNATVTALSDLDLIVIGKRQSYAILQIPEFRGAVGDNGHPVTKV